MEPALSSIRTEKTLAVAPIPQVRGRLARSIDWVIGLRASPEEIGRGVAIGVFVALTPTLGFQIAIAACLATLLNANRTVAIAGVWITNPITVPPIFAVTYAVGVRFWNGPSVGNVGSLLGGLSQRASQQEIWNWPERLKALILVGRNVLAPLTIGGAICGLAAATICYVVVVRVVRQRRAAELCAT